VKIVHVHHHYWPVIGGLENAVRALAEGMAKLGHEVHVVASSYSGGKPKEEMNGVRVHRVKSARLHYPDLTYPLSYPLEALEGADVVHGHSQNSLFTVKVVEKAKRLGVKTVVKTVMYFMRTHSFPRHEIINSVRVIRRIKPDMVWSHGSYSSELPAILRRCDKEHH